MYIVSGSSGASVTVHNAPYIELSDNTRNVVKWFEDVESIRTSLNQDLRIHEVLDAVKFFGAAGCTPNEAFEKAMQFYGGRAADINLPLMLKESMKS